MNNLAREPGIPPFSLAPARDRVYDRTNNRRIPMDLETDLNPTTNPKAQQALSRAQSNRTVTLLPLDDGNIAIFDRSFTLYAIVDEDISYERLKSLSNIFFNKLANRTAEARLYGEPDDRAYARDLKNGRKPTPTSQFEKRATRGTVIDITL